MNARSICKKTCHGVQELDRSGCSDRTGLAQLKGRPRVSRGTRSYDVSYAGTESTEECVLDVAEYGVRSAVETTSAFDEARV